ncbi:MAG: 50S ribosomal protein L9 [Thermodesulfobacteriota bacterium]|nr:50S ribosomal protein L9 [Thermodesulfobacteriota bacterium]
MEVILLEDIPDLGQVGLKVKVADGFGRNYLLPQKKALKATPQNIKLVELEIARREDIFLKEKKIAEKLAKKISGISCTISKQVGDEDKLFGSVTSMDIEKALKQEKIDIDRKNIILSEPIKSIGIYTVPIKLHSEVTAQLKVWVVKSTT